MNRWAGRGAAMILLPLAVACSETGEAANGGVSIPTVVVGRGVLNVTAEATGEVEPLRSVAVTSKASGEILRLYVDVGDKVEPGALLAEVDPRDVRNGYNQAAADLDVAHARMDIAEAQLTRSSELREAGVITEQEFESANLEYANARATLVKAQTNEELNKLRLEDVTIRAPLAGTILSKNVEEGVVIQSASQNVSGGTTLVVMANLDEMQVRTMVDETDMGEIKAGMTALVVVEAFPDRTFVGTVEKIEPQAVVQQNVTMFPVIVRLDNRGGLLLPGMNAEVEIYIDEAIDVLLIPNNAVVTLQDVAAAALVLGLDPETLDLRSLMGSVRGRGGPGGGGQRPGGNQRPGGGQQRPGGGGENASGFGGGDRAQFDSIRARVTRGEITQDSARALFSGRVGGGQGRVGGARDGAAGAGAEAGPTREARPGVVFVINADGAMEPRVVMMGLNDWDFTEIVSGLEEGDEVAVIGAAQLLAQQAEQLERFRGRTGGSPFGGGGRGREE